MSTTLIIALPGCQTRSIYGVYGCILMMLALDERRAWEPLGRDRAFRDQYGPPDMPGMVARGLRVAVQKIRLTRRRVFRVFLLGSVMKNTDRQAHANGCLVVAYYPRHEIRTAAAVSSPHPETHIWPVAAGERQTPGPHGSHHA